MTDDQADADERHRKAVRLWEIDEAVRRFADRAATGWKVALAVGLAAGCVVALFLFH